MKDHKLFAVVFTPFRKRFEEMFTVDFLIVNVCTMLRCDVKNMIVTLFESRNQIRLRKHPPHNFSGGSSNKNLSRMILLQTIYDRNNSVSINLRSSHFVADSISLKGNNLGRNDATVADKFRSRYVLNDLTVHLSVVHTAIMTARKTRSSSKEIGPSRNFRTSSNRNKEIARDTVMCFVKVSTINVNARINNTTQRMIGGKDDAGLTCYAGSVVEQRNLVTLGGAEVISFTTVNMTNMSISGVNLLHELLTQLVCQQDTRSNHNNGLRTVSEQTQRVTDHDKGLATASRHDDLTLAVPCHGVQ